MFGFLFHAAGRDGAFQPFQHRGPFALGNRRFWTGLPLAVHVQLHIQLHQTGVLDPQFLLIGEGFAHFLLRGGLLLVKVIQLDFDAFQPLGHLGKRVVNPGQVAARVRAQGGTVGHPAFQLEHIFLLKSVKGYKHSKSPVAADLHRLGAFNLLAGVQKGGSGVLFVGERIAPDFHAGKSVCRVGVRRQGFHIRFQALDKAFVFLDLLREVL